MEKQKVKLGKEYAILMRTRFSQKQAPKPKAYTVKDRKENKIKWK